jgi:hypothetical protein
MDQAGRAGDARELEDGTDAELQAVVVPGEEVDGLCRGSELDGRIEQRWDGTRLPEVAAEPAEEDAEAKAGEALPTVVCEQLGDGELWCRPLRSRSLGTASGRTVASRPRARKPRASTNVDQPCRQR